MKTKKHVIDLINTLFQPHLIALIIITILFTACSPRSTGKKTNPIENEPSMVAYGYGVADAGEGWNLGQLRLAFTNTRDYMVPKYYIGNRTGASHDVSDAFVNTTEGKTYPIHVYADYSEFAKAEGSAQSGDNYISFSNVAGIPPGFTVSQGMTFMKGNNTAWGNYVLEFKFAKAAHPTEIVFPSREEWRIDLSNVPDSLEMPITSNALADKHITSIEGKVLFDEAGKMLVTIGKCTQGNIPLIASNRNKLDTSFASFKFPAIASFTEGKVIYNESKKIDLNVGPDQTETYNISIPLYKSDTSYMVFYWTDSIFDVVSTTNCGQ